MSTASAVAFYVSSHGYGHGIRTAQVIAALESQLPGITVYARTMAPQWLFADCGAVHGSVAVDSPIVESPDALHIDGPMTVRGLRQFLAASESTVSHEVQFLRQHGVQLLVADIPFLAGAIAAASGIPCIGISNFTWNWILEPFLTQAGGTEMLETIEAAYANLQELWQPGLSQTDSLTPFRCVRQVPAIARKRKLNPLHIRQQLGIAPDAFAAVVFVAARGQLALETVLHAAASAPQYVFLVPAEIPSAFPNVRPVAFSREWNFSEILGAADVVVSKLGYGTVVECMAAQKRLLYPPRFGFVEDEITKAQAPRVLNLHPIPLADYAQGHWAAHLDALLRQPSPPDVMDCSGAVHCGALLAERL